MVVFKGIKDGRMGDEGWVLDGPRWVPDGSPRVAEGSQKSPRGARGFPEGPRKVSECPRGGPMGCHRYPMDFYGFIRVPMGTPWIPMGSHGYSMDFY